MEYNCPICDKGGLPDFRVVPTSCPQCNTDLRGFILIEQIKKDHELRLNKQKWLYIPISMILLISLVSIIIFKPQKNNIDSPSAFVNKDSTMYFKQKVDSINSILVQHEQNLVTTKYIVKKGDNLSKIAYIFFGDWSKYKQIMIDNNLTENDKLMPYDTLIIKLYAK